jgi:hypothetical protein
MKTPAATPPKPKFPLRPCRYCRGKFRPTRKNQHFCTAGHRINFWKYGALPFDKLIARLEKIIETKLAPIRGELAELRNRSHQHTPHVYEVPAP